MIGFGSIANQKVGGVVPPVVQYLLDMFPGAVYAKSLRKLVSNAGAITRVRETLNDNEDDFLANQILNIPGYTGANNGAIVNLYGQTINDNGSSQSIITRQPLIVDNGTLVTSNGFPAISFVGGGKSLLNPTIIIPQPYTLFAVLEIKNISGFKEILGTSNTNYILGQNNNVILVRLGGGGQAYSVGLSVNQRLIVSVVADDINTTVQVNNETPLNTGITPGTAGIEGLSISRRNDWDGLFLEAVIFEGDQTSNRSAIVNELNTYYNVY
ncbi:MAG: hypothetical protein LAT81_08880 [Oceanicaulis sp.]|nr:hypothetical protein [Oceanicaulis sp.]